MKALIALLLVASTAHAGKRTKPVADDAPVVFSKVTKKAPAAGGTTSRVTVKHDEEEEDEEEVDDETEAAPLRASAKVDDSEEVDAEPIEVERKAAPPRRWSIEVGPSVWAASVATTIELGPIALQRNVSFAQIAQYLDGGMSGGLEARYGRFTGSGSFQFGRLATTKEIQDGMGEIGGSLTSVIAEGAVGYAVLGGADKRFSVEPRVGFRYNSLALEGEGSLDVGGTAVTAAAGFHRAGTDYLIGARGRVKLHDRVSLVATGDTRVAGDSYATWSLAGDVKVRAARWLSVSAGWRVLETVTTPMTVRRNGPQLVAMFGW